MGEGVATVEGATTNGGETVRRGDPGQQGAGDECVVSDASDAAGQRDRDESITGVEGKVVDGGIAIGHIDVPVSVGRVPTHATSSHATEQCEKEQRRTHGSHLGGKHLGVCSAHRVVATISMQKRSNNWRVCT